MSTVVGFDLSLTSSGIAILVDGRPKVITHVGHKGRDGASYRERSRRVRSQCQAVMAVLNQAPKLADPRKPSGTRWRFDLAVIEGPSYGSQDGHAFDRAALWHGVYGALEAKGVPIAVISPPTLKLWFTGNGGTAKGAEPGEAKRRMLDTARIRCQPAISCTDEADAYALATAGCWYLGDPIPWTPIERSVECLGKVDWPEAVRV